MTQEALKLAFEAFQYVVTPSGGTRAYVWDSNEARLVADAYRALEKALAQPEQEPDDLTIAYMAGVHDGKKAQRTWVGLEGEEIRNLWEEATKPDRSTMTMVTSFARAIEAKLKERNT